MSISRPQDFDWDGIAAESDRISAKFLAAAREYLDDDGSILFASQLSHKVAEAVVVSPESGPAVDLHMAMFAQNLTPREVVGLLIFARLGLAVAFADLAEYYGGKSG